MCPCGLAANAPCSLARSHVRTPSPGLESSSRRARHGPPQSQRASRFREDVQTRPERAAHRGDALPKGVGGEVRPGPGRRVCTGYGVGVPFGRSSGLSPGLQGGGEPGGSSSGLVGLHCGVSAASPHPEIAARRSPTHCKMQDPTGDLQGGPRAPAGALVCLSVPGHRIGGHRDLQRLPRGPWGLLEKKYPTTITQGARSVCGGNITTNSCMVASLLAGVGGNT